MDMKDKEREYIINTYGRDPVSTPLITAGEGVYVWDDAGRGYLDFLSGLAVNSLGHCHPEVVDAIQTQAAKLMHTSNLYYTEPQIRLAEQLVTHSAMDEVFFGNSGAEANEAAIKLARKYGKAHRGPDAYEIITAERSFHGRTLAAVSATGQPKYHQGFEPRVGGFRYGIFNQLDSFAELVNEATCAIMVEPIQGEGGVYPASREFLTGLRRLCDENDLLLILDEVQCGMGRTGALFAYEHYGVVPDVLTLAKAVGGGLPLGVMGARGEATEVLTPGTHASTFGGNPVTCAAGEAVMKVVLTPGFLEHVQQVGQYFTERLSTLAQRWGKEVRGLGLMVALEIEGDGDAVARYCLENGLLLNCIGGNILRFLPPLIIGEEHVDAAMNIVSSALSAESSG